MEPIDGVSRAIKLLRQRMASNLSERQAAASRQAHSAPAAQPLVAGHVRVDIAARLRALDAADPHFNERAVETFVEGVLLDEFGAEMINDVQFRQVILGVVRAMRAEPQTARQLDKLIVALRRQ